MRRLFNTALAPSNRLLTDGLLAGVETAAMAGLAPPGVRVSSVRQVSADTFRVAFAPASGATVPVRVTVDGRDRGATLDRAVTLRRSGNALQVDFRETTPAWGVLQFPERVLVQWEEVADAAAYEIRDADTDALLATVPAGDGQYLTWTSPPQSDGQTVTFAVTPTSTVGADGAAVERTIEVVTLPADTTAAVITKAAGMTFDVT